MDTNSWAITLSMLLLVQLVTCLFLIGEGSKIMSAKTCQKYGSTQLVGVVVSVVVILGALGACS